MPRPRTVSDPDIFAATVQAAGEQGPAKLTLAHVAKTVGIAPATLIQRFGTKRGLLLAAFRHGLEGSASAFSDARKKNASPLEALLGVLVECAAFLAMSPEVLANHLAFLQIDLTDPEFYELTLKQALDTQASIRALLEEAVAAGELIPCDTEKLARAVHDVNTGAVLNWAIFRDGSVDERVLQDLATLLSPLRILRQKR